MEGNNPGAEGKGLRPRKVPRGGDTWAVLDGKTEPTVGKGYSWQ
jgi:hypothetical protein